MKKLELSKLMLIMTFTVIMTSGPLSAFADQEFVANLAFENVVQEGPSNPSIGASGMVTLTLDESNPADPKLHYWIQLSGIDIDGSQTGTTNDDLTGLHMHVSGVGSNGPHVLNIVSEPCNDDLDVVIDAVAGTIHGTYDDSDLSTLAKCSVGPGPAVIPPLPGQSKKLSLFLDDLKTGGFYFQVHTKNNPSPNGELRGHIVADKGVGGEFLQLDSTALVLAGIQSSAIWMLPVLAGAAGAGALFIKTRMNKE